MKANVQRRRNDGSAIRGGKTSAAHDEGGGVRAVAERQHATYIQVARKSSQHKSLSHLPQWNDMSDPSSSQLLSPPSLVPPVLQAATKGRRWKLLPLPSSLPPLSSLELELHPGRRQRPPAEAQCTGTLPLAEAQRRLLPPPSSRSSCDQRPPSEAPPSFLLPRSSFLVPPSSLPPSPSSSNSIKAAGKGLRSTHSPHCVCVV